MTATHKFPMPTVSFDLTTSGTPRLDCVRWGRKMQREPSWGLLRHGHLDLTLPTRDYWRFFRRIPFRS